MLGHGRIGTGQQKAKSRIVGITRPHFLPVNDELVAVQDSGEKVELGHSSFSAFLHSPERRVRREAFQKYYTQFDTHKNTIAATLNGTLCAIARTIACLLEVHQRADGSMYVPKALRPWLGGVEQLSPGMNLAAAVPPA